MTIQIALGVAAGILLAKYHRQVLKFAECILFLILYLCAAVLVLIGKWTGDILLWPLEAMDRYRERHGLDPTKW